jgi:hypothetical protein
MEEKFINLILWMAGGSGGLVIILLTTYIGLTVGVRNDLGRLRIDLAEKYVGKKDWCEAKDENITAHTELWKEHRRTAEDVARMQGKINGAVK